MNVETLTLINERSSIGREVNNGLLRNLPHRLVDGLEVRRNVGHCFLKRQFTSEHRRLKRGGKSETKGRKRTVLDRSVVSNDGVLHGVVPKSTIDEVAQEPRVDNLELSSEYTTRVDVAGRCEERASVDREAQQ